MVPSVRRARRTCTPWLGAVDRDARLAGPLDVEAPVVEVDGEVVDRGRQPLRVRLGTEAFDTVEELPQHVVHHDSLRSTMVAAQWAAATGAARAEAADVQWLAR